ncbi:hypothetical protein LQF66_03565 [Tetragenococcus halophilus]|uniref:hypothetical protein n=1 Tax=Tetragenococcus halophilus TaxID=51669 RepID=UPI001F1B0339|nr:hypothetical protein [Tetragenococcus halophilus]MCF1675401.1 hypothetical protein [Tetragenococcus halophilus]
MKNALLPQNDQRQLEKKFNPKLNELPAFHLSQPYFPVDLDLLHKEIATSNQANFKEEIYAILPYGKHYTQSFIIYKDTIREVDNSANLLAEKFLKQHLHMEMESYKKTMKVFLNKNIHTMPIANHDFSLVPFSLDFRPTTYNWINPGKIKELFFKANNARTIIQLTNCFNIEIDRQQRAILNRMKRGFLIHGIVKRDIENQPINVTMNLLEYLGISSTRITRKVTRDVQYQHIPGFANDFYQKYQEIHDAMVIEKYFNENFLPKK